MTTKLSHSAKDKINTCGALYKYHYIDRLRPDNTTSALFYGKALDDAFGTMLMEKMSPPPPILECPYEVFKKALEYTEINGEKVLTTDIRCQYYKGDLEPSLCSDPDRALVLIEHYSSLKDELLQEFNILANESLLNKGKLILDAYQAQVMPQIERVYSIQEKVSLPNDEGDEIVGYIDFICSFIDEPNVQYICDNKTSSKNYKSDSVTTSEQLATYCDYKLLNKAAYIVVNKTMKRKEPYIGIQIIRDTIPDSMFESVFDTYGKALYTIRQEDYGKNFNSGCFFFGRKCSYYNFCRSGDTTGLVKLKGDNTNGKS